jgi:hypothetical protein
MQALQQALQVMQVTLVSLTAYRAARHRTATLELKRVILEAMEVRLVPARVPKIIIMIGWTP